MANGSASSRTVKVGVLVVGQGLNTLVNLLFLPFLARTLSIEDYGSYGQTLAAGDFLLAVFTLGVGSTINLEYSRHKDDEGSVFKSSLTLALLSGAAGFLLLAAMAPALGAYFHNEHLAPLLRLYAVSLLFQVPFIAVNATLVYFGRIKESVVIQFVTNFVRIGLLFIAIRFYQSLPAVFIALIAVPVLQAGLAYAWVPRSLREHGRAEAAFMRNLVLVGVPLGLTGILGTMLHSTDDFMVSRMLSVGDFAVFRNGAFEFPFISTVYGSISAIVLPELAQLYAKRDIAGLTHLKRKATTAAAIVIFPVLAMIIFFSEPLIVFYLSGKYAASAPVFLIMNLLLLVRMNDALDILILAEKTSLIFRCNLICALSNIGLNFAFIRLWGPAGAAFATFLSISVLAAWLLRESARELKVSVLEYYDLGRLAKIGFASLSLALIARQAYGLRPSSPVLLGVLSVYMLLIYFVLVFYLKLVDRSILARIGAKVPLIGRMPGFAAELNAGEALR